MYNIFGMSFGYCLGGLILRRWEWYGMVRILEHLELGYYLVVRISNDHLVIFNIVREIVGGNFEALSVLPYDRGAAGQSRSLVSRRTGVRGFQVVTHFFAAFAVCSVLAESYSTPVSQRSTSHITAWHCAYHPY